MQMPIPYRPILKWMIFGIIFLITLELCARLDDYFRYGAALWSPYDNEILAMQDEYGRRGKPGARFKNFELNQFGFLMPPMQKQAKSGTVRVLLLGASELFGPYETPGFRLSDQLQKRLPSGYEVINAAFFGRSLPRIIDFYERYLRQFDAQIAVIYASPIFYLDFEAPKVRIASSTSSARQPRFQVRLMGKLKDAGKQNLPQWFQSKVRSQIIERQIAHKPPDYVWQKPPEQRLELFTAHLNGLVELLQKDGLKVVLVTHPSRFMTPPSPERDFWALAWRQSYPRATIDVIRQTEEIANLRTRQIGAKTGAKVADLAGGVKWTSEMFADFCHFTDQGAAKAAGILAAAIDKIPVAADGTK